MWITQIEVKAENHVNLNVKFTLTELFRSPIHTYLNELQNFCKKSALVT